MNLQDYSLGELVGKYHSYGVGARWLGNREKMTEIPLKHGY
jgi:hypothetical protein